MFSSGLGVAATISALAVAMAAIYTQPAAAQTAKKLDCKGCVKSKQIKNNGIKSTDIKDGQVGLGDLSPAVQKVIADLQAQVAALQGEVAALAAQAGFVSDLAAVVALDEVPTDLDGNGTIDPASELLPRVLFQGVNVQVVNGDPSEETQSVNGLGNLIVGYNEDREFGPVCSNGEFDDNDPADGDPGCEDRGFVWAVNHKSGSHNLVVGPFNAYSQTGGAVFGSGNVVNREGASVTGGLDNIASGFLSSVSAGDSNIASGNLSSVSGGDDNIASGIFSSVSGGFDNLASEEDASVTGGWRNTAEGLGASVSGGSGVTISGECQWGGEGVGPFGAGAC